MEINEYIKIFYNSKRVKNTILGKEFEKFQRSYKNKSIAAKRFFQVIEEKEKNQTLLIINGREYYDDFKFYFKSKMNIEYDERKSPIDYMINEFLPNHKLEYMSKKEYETSNNSRPSFDYSFLDNLTNRKAVDFFAEIKAIEDFKNFLIKMSFSDDRNSVNGIKINSSKRFDFIYNIHLMLYNEGFIHVGFDEFLLHFDDSFIIDKIQWNGSAPEIISFFFYVCNQKQSVYEVIVDHFVNKSGNDFIRENLYAAKSKSNSKKVRIDEIIRELKKIN
jgi:hypothetical protein